MTPFLRPSTEVQITKAIQHFLTLCFALALSVAGFLILWYNIKSLTTPLLIAIGLCFGVAMLLAIRTNFEEAVTFAAQYVPFGKKKDAP